MYAEPHLRLAYYSPAELSGVTGGLHEVTSIQDRR